METTNYVYICIDIQLETGLLHVLQTGETYKIEAFSNYYEIKNVNHESSHGEISTQSKNVIKWYIEHEFANVIWTKILHISANDFLFGASTNKWFRIAGQSYVFVFLRNKPVP